MPMSEDSSSPLGNWLRTMLERRHKNIVVVALANKLTRIAWAVVAGGVHYTEFTAAEAV
jgi:transposase